MRVDDFFLGLAMLFEIANMNQCPFLFVNAYEATHDFTIFFKVIKEYLIDLKRI